MVLHSSVLLCIVSYGAQQNKKEHTEHEMHKKNDQRHVTQGLAGILNLGSYRVHFSQFAPTPLERNLPSPTADLVVLQ